MKNRRKKYLISPLQVKTGLWALALFGSAILAIWWEVRGDLLSLQQGVTLNYFDPSFRAYVGSYASIINKGILMKSIFVLTIIWFAVVLVLHHILGPLYRFKMCMKAVKDGDYSTRMKLRKNDYLTDVADSFNEMAASIENRNKR